MGFTYNAWRLEVTEDNNNVRTAAFEVLKELAALEQLIYAAHYDKNPQEGNPRKGWVKVGLIVDLCELIDDSALESARELKGVWQDHWREIEGNRDVVEELVERIDGVRVSIKMKIQSLE